MWMGERMEERVCVIRRRGLANRSEGVGRNEEMERKMWRDSLHAACGSLPVESGHKLPTHMLPCFLASFDQTYLRCAPRRVSIQHIHDRRSCQSGIVNFIKADANRRPRVGLNCQWIDVRPVRFHCLLCGILPMATPSDSCDGLHLSCGFGVGSIRSLGGETGAFIEKRRERVAGPLSCDARQLPIPPGECHLTART